MATLSPREPDVHLPGDGGGPHAPAGAALTLPADASAPAAGGWAAISAFIPGAHWPKARKRRIALSLLAAAIAGRLALGIALYAGVIGIAAVPAALRVGTAAVALFGVCGFGLTHLFLPAALRRYEALWVLPVGACAAALALTVLGFAGSPFHLSLAVSLAGFAVLGVYALRRGPVRIGGRPAAHEGVGGSVWPVYVAVLLVCVALIPMFRSGFATVIGDGSDAHLAVGTAQFLQHAYPTGSDIAEPIDRVPLLWHSKQPIYYALGAVASLSGLEPYQTIATLAALMLALAAVGWFLLAREVLGAGLAGALMAMAIAGLDRMVLHTGMHPYFNQTWGYFTLPFALVLAWWVAHKRTRSLGGGLLLLLALALGAFAYPLALPIPVIGLIGFWLSDRRARKRAGEPVTEISWRRAKLVYHGRRSLLWIVPLVAALALPIEGVAQKMRGAAQVISPGFSLVAWGGDLNGYFPLHEFFSVSSSALWPLAAVVLLVFVVLELRRHRREVAAGIGAVLVFGALAAAFFAARKYGYYFHFKTLAFIAPLAVVVAAVGMSRYRRVGSVLLIVFLASAIVGAKAETRNTYDQLPKTIIGLRAFDKALPPSASVRLDMNPSMEIWAGYMMSGQPLCSERPLLGTAYPHVPLSRKADYVLVDRGMLRPFDAVGAPVMHNQQFRLYRLRSDIPGPDRCSRALIETVRKGAGSL